MIKNQFRAPALFLSQVSYAKKLLLKDSNFFLGLHGDPVPNVGPHRDPIPNIGGRAAQFKYEHLKSLHLLHE